LVSRPVAASITKSVSREENWHLTAPAPVSM
jgi:hypothetical protein